MAKKSNKNRALTAKEADRTIRAAEGVLASAGHYPRGAEVHADTRRALRGEITFDEAASRIAARSAKRVAKRAAERTAAS
ncbi:hypothetical protein [Promicromonospora sp. NPDC023805]|uniref:hypothetical protein n=1 Tax=Promicromonospora sp. NPDC023805 TaxID=3154696 RepID=UPI0033D4B083